VSNAGDQRLDAVADMPLRGPARSPQYRVGVSPDVFALLNVTSWSPYGTEPSGLDDKEWLSEPTDEGGDDRQWLVKPIKVHDGWVKGEDRAEKIASEVAELLGMQYPRVEMASCADRLWSVSLNLRPWDWEMHSGAVVQSDLLPGYRTGSAKVKGRHPVRRMSTRVVARGYRKGSGE
jgi:hypothetical protein